MQIRCETANDRGRVATLIARTYGAQGAHVIELTGRLRAESSPKNELGFVAEVESEVEAYALFTPLQAGSSDHSAALLAPFAVNIQNTDFDAQSFVRSAIDKVKEQGFRYVFLLGLPQELEEDGFLPAEESGLSFEKGVETGHILVRDFGDKCGASIEGEIQLPACLKE